MYNYHPSKSYNIFFTHKEITYTLTCHSHNPTSSITLWCFGVITEFCFSNFDTCIVVLICITLMTNDVEHGGLIFPLYIFFSEIFVHVFCPFSFLSFLRQSLTLVAQAGLELRDSSHPPRSTFQSAEITDGSHHTQPAFWVCNRRHDIIFRKTLNHVSLKCKLPGSSPVAERTNE